MSVTKIMNTRLVSVSMDDSLATVKEIFDRARFHHLLVIDNGQLFGVVSDRDLLKAISPNLGTLAETARDTATLNKRVHQIMTRKPITLTMEAGIYDAVHIFNSQHVSCIPVVDAQGRARGIISWRDIVKEIERQRLERQQ